MPSSQSPGKPRYGRWSSRWHLRIYRNKLLFSVVPVVWSDDRRIHGSLYPIGSGMPVARGFLPAWVRLSTLRPALRVWRLVRQSRGSKRREWHHGKNRVLPCCWCLVKSTRSVWILCTRGDSVRRTVPWWSIPRLSRRGWLLSRCLWSFGHPRR